MPFGMTYIELVQVDKLAEKRAKAEDDLRYALGGGAALAELNYEQLCAVHRQRERDRREAWEKEAQERERQRALQYVQSRQEPELADYAEFRRHRAAQIAARETACCTPRRDSVMPCQNFDAKCHLYDDLNSPTRTRTTPRERVAFEWGYIKALRDTGQTEEADRLVRKMRRGSIFRKERIRTDAQFLAAVGIVAEGVSP